MVPVGRLAGPANAAARRHRKSLSNCRLELQLCAWFIGPRGLVLVLSTARAMEHRLSPFGGADLHPRRNRHNRSRSSPEQHQKTGPDRLTETYLLGPIHGL